MDFKNSLTKQNLAKAFAAECQAGARYQFMATQAQTDKMFYIKDTLKSIAKNEMAHAKLFYNYILEYGGEKCVVDFEADYPYVCPALEKSLKTESEIEEEEFSTIYPEFARIAKEEGFKDVAESFEIVAGVEDSHAQMLKKLAEEYKSNKLYKSEKPKVFRCSNCGHLGKFTEAWKKCPLCSLEQGYVEIDFSDIFCKCLK